MEAATRVIVTEGLRAPTATIAREAGVSSGSLFTYFDTKAELLNQLYLELKTGMAAAALEGLGTLLGGGKHVDPIAISELKPFVPSTFAGLPRKNTTAEKTGIASLMISNAEATYGDDAEKRVTLKISDSGGASGLVGLASWAGGVLLLDQVDTRALLGRDRGPSGRSRRICWSGVACGHRAAAGLAVWCAFGGAVQRTSSTR